LYRLKSGYAKLCHEAMGSNPIVHPNSVLVAHVYLVSRAARALLPPKDDKDLREDRYPKR
jgi:hypothetical protein